MILRYACTGKDTGRTVYSILRNELGISASLVKNLKKSQGIFVDGVPQFTIYKLRSGNIVSADVLSAEPLSDIVPQTGTLSVLYEDNGLLAVNKPAGILVHPSRAKYTGTLSNYVSGYLQANGQPPCCHTVNRLDRDTSGVVLFSKNSYMKARLAASMKDSVKEYLALVCGYMPEHSGTISLPIKRMEEGNMLRIPSSDGQPAITHYQTIRTANIHGVPVSLLKLRLETGRTHQIRVHCKAMGCPLLGDILYFNEQSQKLSENLHITGQLLHAYTLFFPNPLSGVFHKLTAPILRDDMNMALHMI